MILIDHSHYELPGIHRGKEVDFSTFTVIDLFGNSVTFKIIDVNIC